MHIRIYIKPTRKKTNRHFFCGFYEHTEFFVKGLGKETNFPFFRSISTDKVVFSGMAWETVNKPPFKGH